MEQPNYYAILTAEVRYSKLINANEKILFAEITALSNKTGECWASNNYFAQLYDVTPQAISKWVNNLAKHGFILLNYIYKSGSNEIEKRIIKGINVGCNVSTYDSEVSTYDSEVSTTDCGGYQQRIKDNNTSINNKHNSIINNINVVVEHFNKVTNSKTKGTKEVLANIEFLLKTYSVDEIKKVIDFIANDNWYIENKYVTLSTIFKRTKFNDKFERANCALVANQKPSYHTMGDFTGQSSCDDVKF